VDVDDCVAGARALADRGIVDPARFAIEGGSASGFTTLAALAFRDVFRAGVSYFGIGNLAAFAAETHKFESRYLEGLVGPYPAARDVYEDRSPVFHLDGIHSPVLVLQGLDDRIVPPAEAERIVAALRENGVPYAFIPFEGEDHGFRKASSILRSIQASSRSTAPCSGSSRRPLPPLPLVGAPPGAFQRADRRRQRAWAAARASDRCRRESAHRRRAGERPQPPGASAPAAGASGGGVLR